MFTVGKNVHDSINALSFLDEVRQISRLIAAFISKVKISYFEKIKILAGNAKL